MNAGDALKLLGIGGLAIFAALKVWDATMLLRELKVALIGIDGKNGIRAEVRAVDAKVSDLSERVNQHHERLAALAPVKQTRRRR